ncbi:hypothetical protein ACI2KR_27690 [Pseudomonas luteola]
MMKTSIFALLLLQVILILSGLLLYFISTFYYNYKTYQSLPLWLLLSEVFLMLGFVQLRLEIDRKRYERLYKPSKPVSFRLVDSAFTKEKLNKIASLFGQSSDLKKLADELVEKWEWYRRINYLAGEPAEIRAKNFFSFPSAGNFATYLAGLLAVIAAVIVALIDKDNFYKELPQIWETLKEAWFFLMIVFAFPFIALVYPAALILGVLRLMGNSFLERINDDYLSQSSFYGFIKELAEFEERKERRLLMSTASWFYWFIRITTVPIGDVKNQINNARRALLIARIRRNRKIL